MAARQIYLVSGFDPSMQINGDSIRLMSWCAFFQKQNLEVNLLISSESSQVVNPSFWSRTGLNTPQVRFCARKYNTSGYFARIKLHTKAVLGGMPPWIAATYSEELERILEQAPENAIILFLGEAAGIYLNETRRTNSLWDKSNVLTFSTYSEFKDSKGAASKLRYYYHHVLARRFEKQKLVLRTWVTASSEAEIGRLTALSDCKKFRLLRSANGTYAPIRLDLSSKKIGWIGSFGYGPNWRGLIKFLSQADDSLNKSGIKIKIIGAGAEEWQKRELARFSSVIFVGYVEQIDDAVIDCKFIVVPVWSGAGIKIKSLDALRLGLPLLSTPNGMEGIDEKAAIFISDNPLDFMGFLEKVDDEQIYKNLDDAKQVYVSNFTQEAFELKLFKIYSEALLDFDKL